MSYGKTTSGVNYLAAEWYIMAYSAILLTYAIYTAMTKIDARVKTLEEQIKKMLSTNEEIFKICYDSNEITLQLMKMQSLMKVVQEEHQDAIQDSVQGKLTHLCDDTYVYATRLSMDVVLLDIFSRDRECYHRLISVRNTIIGSHVLWHESVSDELMCELNRFVQEDL